MNGEWLRTFVAFAERASFTAAARALHLSQPAVHVQVRKLSESLGVALYRREGRTLVLTPAGERLRAFGREQEERTEALVAELAGRPIDQPVVLAAGAGAYLYMLGDAIRAFTRLGAARLRLLTHDRDAAVAAVKRGDAHLGVAVLDHTPDGLSVELLAEVGAAVVMPGAHPLAKKRRLKLTDLSGERLIVPPEGRPHRTALSRALMSASVAWEPAIEATGWELSMHFARLGLGLAVVNAFCAPPPGCVSRPLLDLPRVPYSLFQQRGRKLDPAALSLRQLLLKSARPR